jgi:hypothetical protein
MNGRNEGDLSPSAEMAPYWRRWLRGAFAATSRFYGLTPAALVLTLAGPAIGSFLLAYITAGPKGLSGATASAQWLLYGFLGTLLLVALTWLVQLVRTPARLEFEAKQAGKRREVDLLRQVQDALASKQELEAAVDDASLRGVDVSVDDGQLPSVECGDSAREVWTKRQWLWYMKPLEAYKAQQSSYPFGLGGLMGDPRGAGDYTNEVNHYLAEISSCWIPALRKGAIWRDLALLRLAILNLRDVSIEGVELTVVLPADVGAGWGLDAEDDKTVPSRPERWTHDRFLLSLPDANLAFSSLDKSRPGEIERVDGQLHVTWERVDLGASGRARMTPVSLFIPSSYAGQALPIDWTITSRRTRGVVNGHSEVSISPAALPPSRALDRDSQA